MRRTISGLLMMLTSSAIFADDVAIPSIGQPTPFYGAAGKGVTIDASLNRHELAMGESIQFTVRVRGLLNPAEVQRPDLNAIDAFAKDFQIEDDGGDMANDSLSFRYRLFPRRVAVAAVPAFSFPYYDPSRPQPPDRPDYPFVTMRTKAIALRIRMRESPPIVAIPMDVPDFALSPVDDEDFAVPDWLLWLAIIAPPIAAIGWCVIWHATHPVGARLAKRRRSRAARLALRRLRSPHSTSTIVDALRGYLAERYDRSRISQIPGDVRLQLVDAKVDATLVDQTVAFFEHADSARFAPNAKVTTDVLVAEAELLIRHHEESP